MVVVYMTKVRMENHTKEQRDFLLELFDTIDHITGRTKLQKLVFLGQKEIGLPELFVFDKYHYGPYSWELTEAVEDLITLGYLREEVEQNGDYITYFYKLSDIVSSDEIPHEYIPESQKDTLKKLAKLSRGTIIEYVYRKYLPERLNS
jgi:uncharacterized protein